MKLSCRFVYDERLDLPLPHMEKPWEQVPYRERIQILHKWEQIRGLIPERIKKLEQQIMIKQERLHNEEDFREACRINDQISDLASRINDLQLWFRVNQGVDDDNPRHP